MNIVAVTACTAGIAHTYLVAEKLQKAAEEWATISRSKLRVLQVLRTN